LCGDQPRTRVPAAMNQSPEGELYLCTA
jgi:hypothetical protein